MTDVFYIVVVIAFASFGVLTLFHHLVRGNEIRDQNRELGGNIDRLEERIAEIQKELHDLRFDTNMMDDERVALEAQGKCMLDLQDRYEREQKQSQSRRDHTPKIR